MCTHIVLGNERTTMTKTFDREALVADMKAHLLAFMAPDQPRTNQWLACEAGELYVRKGTYRVYEEQPHTCFDISNVVLRNKYRGNGILTEVMDWLLTLDNEYVAVYVESIMNRGFAKHLETAGWNIVGKGDIALTPNMIKFKETYVRTIQR